MATVTGLTAARMQEIIDAQVQTAYISGDNLILVLNDDSEINVGNVRGPQGIQGVPGDLIDGPNDGNAYLRRSGAWQRPRIADLNDVDLTGLSDDDVMVWNTLASKWKVDSLSNIFDLSPYALLTQLYDYLPLAGGTITGNLAVADLTATGKVKCTDVRMGSTLQFLNPAVQVYDQTKSFLQNTEETITLSSTLSGVSLTGVKAVQAGIKCFSPNASGGLRVWRYGDTEPSVYFVDWDDAYYSYSMLHVHGIIPIDSSRRFKIKPVSSTLGRVKISVSGLLF